MVLLLLLLGILDLARGFYFAVRLQDAAREGARVGSAYDPQAGSYPVLSASAAVADAAIAKAVNNVLTQSGMSSAQVDPSSTTCPATKDGNADYNPPYADSAYPSSPGISYLYICYEKTPGKEPPLSSPALQPLNVIVLYRFGLVSGFLQNTLGPTGIEISGNYEAVIQ